MFALFSTYTRIKMYVYVFELNVASRHSTYILYTCVCVLVVSIILCDGPELFVKARLIRMIGGPLGRLDLLRHKCGSVGRS